MWWRAAVGLRLGPGVFAGRAVEQGAAGPGSGSHHRGSRSLPGHHHLQMPAGQQQQGKAPPSPFLPASHFRMLNAVFAASVSPEPAEGHF